MRNALNSSHREAREDRKGNTKNPFVALVKRLLTPENLWAIVLFLIAVALIVLTTEDSPNWIYQGF
jgi:hypothetical protein